MKEEEADITDKDTEAHNEAVAAFAEEYPPAKTFMAANNFMSNQELFNRAQEMNPDKELNWQLFFATIKQHGYVQERIVDDMRWIVK